MHILPTYEFFSRLRIAFQTCTLIFLIITWQPCTLLLFSVIVLCDMQKRVLHAKCIRGFTVLSIEPMNTHGSLIDSNPHFTIRQLTQALGISLGSVRMILHDRLHVLCMSVWTLDSMSVNSETKIAGCQSV